MSSAPFRMAPPKNVTASIALEPVYSVLATLSLLNTGGQEEAARAWTPQIPASQQGPGRPRQATAEYAWIPHTAAALTPEQRYRNRLVFEGLGEALLPDRDWPDFSAYLDDLAAQDPLALRDRMLRRICRPQPQGAQPAAETAPPAPASLLADAQAFAAQIMRLYPDSPLDPALLAEVHGLLNNPTAMQELIVSHLSDLWWPALAAEWHQALPLLRGLSHMLTQRPILPAPAAETVRAFAGRDLPGDSSVLLAGVEHIVFTLSPHIELYASKFGSDTTLWVFVGTHVIREWTIRQLPMGRSELLSRFNALADETRLSILELLAHDEELSAQQIIARLGLSQSSISRHLGQLSGLGYLIDRRGDGANKVYQLNRIQFDWTFGALERLLSRKEVGAEVPDRRDEHTSELKRFLNASGRLTTWPAKHRDQLTVLRYLASRFEPGREYSEKEVNEVLNQWHTYNDPAYMRRSLCEWHILERTSDGARYWLATINVKA